VVAATGVHLPSSVANSPSFRLYNSKMACK
jgi:hypothetical protein